VGGIAERTVRDNFSKQTVIEIAKGVGWRCSNCMRPTVAANEAQNDTLIIADAAHICAASPAGPRYDPTQTPAQRRAKENGIWLCKVCARLIDLDPAKYTVDSLRKWKQDAQARALREMLAPRVPTPSEEASRIEVLIGEANRTSASAAFSQTFTVLHAAALADLDTYKRSSGGAVSSVELTLTLYGDPSVAPFRIGELPLAVEVAPEVTIIAPAGTGKSTTLLQLASHVLARNTIIPLFFRLGDWSAGSQGLLASVHERRAFRTVAQVDLESLAERGRLLLLLDGWNEIDSAAQRKLRVEIERIRREFPDVRIIVTTRRQMLDVPISGPRIEIEQLSEDQQVDIARQGYGDAGEKVVDDAWRESGLRELIARPLYLNSLLTVASGGAAPTTKEDILRLFVEQHERAADHAEALHAVIAERHTAVLIAIATKMTKAGATTLSDVEARSVVDATLSGLRQQGQITLLPQPSAVLDVLTSHHTLLRAGNGAISFQHQQFQEWYASHDVYSLVRASAEGDLQALERLRFEIFDQPAWEEGILFAVDRLSRERDAAAILVKAIMDALPVDPMLAAEMIYRSPNSVWESIKIDIQAFVKRWHNPGEADRAVRFMIMTGRPDFASIIWPLASSEESQIQLPTLRGAPRFRPAVLGADLQVKVAILQEPQREHLLALIASESGVDGMDLATDLAIADPSAKIQAEVVQYLQFRRADRHVARLLKNALEETWALVAKRGYAQEIRDPAIAARLTDELNKLIRQSSNPLDKLGLLLEQPPTDQARDEAIAGLIADPNFPVRNQNGSTLYFAQKRAPAAVRQALQKRLELGLELPFDAADLLHQLPVDDDGPIATMVLDDTEDKREARQAAILVGPKTVESLLEKYVACALALKLARNDQALNERYRRLRDRIASTRISSFVPALIAKADQEDPVVISALASLVSQHGDDDEERNAELQVPAPFKDQVIGVMRRWVEAVATSPTGKRHHLYPLANAIGRLAYHELIPELTRLLDEDIARLRKAREGFQEAQQRGDIEATSDARAIYGNQYQDAFVRVGGDEVTTVVAAYLKDALFSVEAALVLMALANRSSTMPAQPSRPFPVFANVAAARIGRTSQTVPRSPSRSETAIFDAIDHLGRADKDRESQLLAIRLGGIALMMPHTNRDKEIAALMALPQPVSAKRELLLAMVLDGVTLDASLIMQAIDDWLQDAGKSENTAWHKRQHTWEIEPWLELLPFTDRPRSVVEGMGKVKDFYGAGHRQHFDRVVSAVANVPGPDGEALLAEFVRAHKDIASDYTWTRAILSRDTASAAVMCLELFTDGLLGKGPHSTDVWHLAREIAPLVERYPELEADLRERYGRMVDGPGRNLLQRLFSEMGDGEDVIVMVKSYIAAGQSYDGQLARALRSASLWHEPVAGSQNSYYVRPASVANLRRFLFGLSSGKANEATLVLRCLVEIDELRDEHGIAAGDPRHPDIRSDRPWPPEAGRINEQKL
jgi:NACHT C-terminal Alpha/Beta 2